MISCGFKFINVKERIMETTVKSLGGGRLEITIKSADGSKTSISVRPGATKTRQTDSEGNTSTTTNQTGSQSESGSETTETTSESK